jgi:hypothetical protein
MIGQIVESVLKPWQIVVLLIALAIGMLTLLAYLATEVPKWQAERDARNARYAVYMSECVVKFTAERCHEVWYWRLRFQP